MISVTTYLSIGTVDRKIIDAWLGASDEVRFVDSMRFSNQ